jgi:hypothetical protein
MIMADSWENELACLLECPRCSQPMAPQDQRILSVYDHKPICMDCKRAEEHKSDYEEVSKRMIGQCLIDTELAYSDPSGYCYHHFYPYTC